MQISTSIMDHFVDSVFHSSIRPIGLSVASDSLDHPKGTTVGRAGLSGAYVCSRVGSG